MSKGSKRRPEDRKKIDENWDRIFGDKAQKSVPKPEKEAQKSE